MRNRFERNKNSKGEGNSYRGETTSYQDKKCHFLYQENNSGWEDFKNIVSPERANQEKGRYKPFEKFKLYDGNDDLEKLNKFPPDTINFINTYKDKMIKGNILTEDEFENMMKTFQERVDKLNRQVESLRDALKNGASPSAGLHKPHVKHAYREVAQSAQAFLEKVAALAATQQQEQIQKAGLYQPPEFS